MRSSADASLVIVSPGSCRWIGRRCVSPRTIRHARAWPWHPRIHWLRRRAWHQLVDAKPKAWHDDEAEAAGVSSPRVLRGEPGAEVGPAIGDLVQRRAPQVLVAL